jgi:DNA-directed RNA polymerase specialized sigma24 family protein
VISCTIRSVFVPPKQTAPKNDALAECYSLHAEKLRRFLMRISRSADLTEDLAQDVWVKVAEIQRGENTRAQNITEFESPAAQWSYLSRMAVNHYRDWLRRQRTISIEDLVQRLFSDLAEHESGAEGVDRLAGTRTNYERLRRLAESMEAILDAFANDSSPPHQTIVFGFNRPLQWEPNKIVQLQSHKTLRALGSQLCDDLAEAFFQTEERSHTLCRGLEKRLQRPVAWEHVRTSQAATTELAIYFKKKDLRGRAKEVTQWSLSVQRRIVKQLLAVNVFGVRNKD